MRTTIQAIATVIAVALAAPAQAATFVVTNGGTATFAASATTNQGDKLVDFNGSLPSGVSMTTTGGAAIVSGSLGGQYAQPFGSNGSNYLSVFGGSSATIRDITNVGFGELSFYLGSIDTYNTIQLLDTMGAVIATYTGAAFLGGPSGDQGLATTNRLVSFSRGGSDPLFGGIRFTSSQNSAEIDNVRFAAAVPEPATWAMMLIGFGLLGAAMRRRKETVQTRVRLA